MQDTYLFGLGGIDIVRGFVYISNIHPFMAYSFVYLLASSDDMTGGLVRESRGVL